MQHALNVYVRSPPGVMIISEILIAREQSSEGGCQIPRQGAAEEGVQTMMRRDEFLMNIRICASSEYPGHAN